MAQLGVTTRLAFLGACAAGGMVAACTATQDLGRDRSEEVVEAGTSIDASRVESEGSDVRDASRAEATSLAEADGADASLPSVAFDDPISSQGQVPLWWIIQGQRVRLFARLVANGTSLSALSLRSSLEWAAWRYLRCYERTFGDAGPLPEGTVSVRLYVFNGMTANVKLEQTTITGQVIALTECLVDTVSFATVPQTAAEEGPAIEELRFAVVARSP